MIVETMVIFMAVIYVSLILAFFVGLNRVLSKNNEPAIEAVKLSIIVAFKDEEANLPVLLSALANQTLSSDYFEVILVDDHSSDKSLSVANSFIAKFQNLKVIESPVDSIGKKAALTNGISLASNPLIVFTDADCIPTKFWLESISNIAANGSAFIIGAVTMSPINSFASKLQSLEYSSLMASEAGSCGIGHPILASSANLAFRNDLLKVDAESLKSAISSGDDMFLLHRAKRLKDCRIEFMNDNRSIVQTSTEPTISKALKQRKRWATKSIYYNDFDTIFVGFVVLIFNLILVMLLFAIFIDITYLFYFLILLAIKSFVDYQLINRYLKFTAQDKLLRIFLPLQIVYPFYVVYSFFAGIIVKGNWKGRAIN
ncbi:MAG: glycosyltransferase [Bacteroidales bacterium]|nr:MAG: glycosyltransferase [Bacteroidales bacterium]